MSAHHRTSHCLSLAVVLHATRTAAKMLGAMADDDSTTSSEATPNPAFVGAFT
jgi:hypothetical protein